MIVLSDEASASEEEPGLDLLGQKPSLGADERPGNAQFLETPSLIAPIDFRGVQMEELFGKRREVYRLKAEKLEGLVDCQLCKLIYDYTKTCNHFSMEANLQPDELQTFVKSSQNDKLKALAKVTRSLDILSTARISSFVLKKQIAELLSMYMQSKANEALSPHFKDFEIVTCDKCGLPEDEPVEKFNPTILALKILNRCFTFQIESMVLNQTDDLIEKVLRQGEGSVTIREFAAEPEYTIAVCERLQEELVSSKRVNREVEISFELLY